MKEDPAQDSAPKEDAAPKSKPAAKKSTPKKKAPPKKPVASGSLSEGIEAWVRLRKKPSAQENIILAILEEVGEWEADGSKGELSHAAKQAVAFAKASNGNDED